MRRARAGPEWMALETAMVEPEEYRRRNHKQKFKCPLGYERGFCPCEWESDRCMYSESRAYLRRSR